MVIHLNKNVKLPDRIFSYEVKTNTETGRHECKSLDIREINTGGGHAKLLLWRQIINTATTPT
jgi:hypothetical protein